jgi:hypothetical protein
MNIRWPVRICLFKWDCTTWQFVIYIYIYIYCKNILFIGIQPLGRSGQRPELSQTTGMALVSCILGKFLGVVCHCFPPRSDVPTFATRCPHVRHDARDPSGGRWNCEREYCPVILPKEDLLRIYSLLKIRQLRRGLNPRAWVLKASTLPLDHRRRCKNIRHLFYTLLLKDLYSRI